MPEPFVAEISHFPYNFAPLGWSTCDGQLLPINQNTALFSLLGTMYGGNGQTTFALPDLRGRCVIGPGQGPGLSLRDLGETGGSATVTLQVSEIPSHGHSLSATSIAADSQVPIGNLLGKPREPLFNSDVPTVALESDASSVPASAAHENMPPYLTLEACIALQGVFPPRS